MDDLELAHSLADRADELTMPAFAGERAFMAKAYGTPVTETDRLVERELRALLAAARPDDGFVGEETGAAPGTSGRTWILDPIDGTGSFVAGEPGWATQLALRDDATGAFVVGLTSAPAAGARWWGTSGGGAHLRIGEGEPSRLHVSDAADLAAARWVSHPVLDERLAASCGEAVPVTGHGALMVARGHAEVCLVTDGELWDHAAFAALVAAAGGRCTLLEKGALYTNGVVHDAALALVRS